MVGVSSFLVVATSLAMAAPASFRGAPQLQLQELQESLHETMQAILQGQGSALNKQLDSIEASIWQTFQSLPKKAGHINSRSVRYLVHNYFAKEHGWLIKGLEPHGHQDNVSEVHEMTILQDKAGWEFRMGLSLSDTVAMIATLERLIFDEAHVLLQASYSLNSLKIEDEIDEQSLHEVLMSYLVLFEIGERAVLDNRALHRALKAKAARSDGNWPLLVEFEQDAVHNFNFALRHVRNPFRDSHLYSFQDAQAIIEDLTRGYGKWQNTECQQMKRELMDLDPHGMGRAPLGRFYSQPENAEYHFTETQDYLKKAAASSHWIDRKIAVSKAEREELAVLASQEVVEGPAETLAWSEEEVLATAPSSPGSSGSSGSNSLRFIMQVALLASLHYLLLVSHVVSGFDARNPPRGHCRPWREQGSDVGIPA
eukprot:g31268.t1